jgi:hypothetical protein
MTSSSMSCCFKSIGSSLIRKPKSSTHHTTRFPDFMHFVTKKCLILSDPLDLIETTVDDMLRRVGSFAPLALFGLHLTEVIF